MNFDKIKKVNDDLAKLPTITDKLNHWKINYLDKYSGGLKEYFELETAQENGTGYNDYLSGPLKIPITQNKLILDLHSPSFGIPEKQRIEYYHWMLFFLAEERFKHYTKPALERKYSTPLGKAKLQGRINQITQIQRNAEKRLADGTILIRFKQHPADEDLYLWYADNLYSRVEVPISSMEDPYVVSVCEHKYVLPYLKSLQKTEKEAKQEILKLNGINIPKFVEHLAKREYISESDNKRLQNWFKGIPVKEPIHINKPMSHFASLIADLIEAGYIKNRKSFSTKLIHNSLLFDNEAKSSGSIKNALNENASTRIHKTDAENFIDLQDFILKK